MSVTDELSISENIAFKKTEFVLPYVEPTHSHAKDYAFASMIDCPEKDTKFTKVVMCFELLQ